MGYSLYIERQDSSGEPNEIPLDDWKRAVAATDTVRIASDSGHSHTNAFTGVTMSVSGNAGDAEVFFPDDDEWVSVFNWFGGRAEFSGRCNIGDSSDPVWGAAASIAKALGAIIRGEQGEQYDLSTGNVKR